MNINGIFKKKADNMDMKFVPHLGEMQILLHNAIKSFQC